MKPTAFRKLNLNGSSGNELLSQYRDDMRHAGELRSFLAPLRPHGRDFQFNTADYRPAVDQFDEQMRAVESLCNYLEAHAYDLLKQGAEICEKVN